MYGMYAVLYGTIFFLFFHDNVSNNGARNKNANMFCLLVTLGLHLNTPQHTSANFNTSWVMMLRHASGWHTQTHRRGTKNDGILEKVHNRSWL